MKCNDQITVRQEDKWYERVPIGFPICNSITISHGFIRLNRLLVRLDIEVDEETKIAGKKAAAKNGSRFCSRAVAHVR